MMYHFITFFEKVAAKHPNAIAIRTISTELTYREFNNRINCLANYLLKFYPRNGATAYRIGILHERSLNTLLLMYATWKIGASFILLDPNDLTKDNKIARMLERCKVNLLVTTKTVHNKKITLQNDLQVLYFDDEVEKAIQGMEIDNLPLIRSSRCEAYLIATSGSTGEPKIVVIDHTVGKDTGLVALFEDISNQLEINNNSTVLWDSSLGFDPIVAVPCWTFMGGGALYIASPAEVTDREQLLVTCEEMQINIMLAVPSLAPLLLRHKQRLQNIRNLKILSTGENLTHELVNEWSAIAEGGIFNGYGPTETPVGITLTKTFKDDPFINIGRAIKGREYIVINPHTKQKSKPGEIGELVYKCEGFAGYLNDDIASENRKITVNGETYWRSGDRVCIAVDNNQQIYHDKQQLPILRFIGRDDKQLKIAGVRMDLTALENLLARHHDIVRVHTTVRKPQKVRELARIISFCQVRTTDTTVEHLAHYLQERTRVISHSIILLNKYDSFDNPNYLTKNGKLNEAALIAQYHTKVYPERKIQQTIIERLRRHWSDILNITTVDDDANFYELGGDSFSYLTLQLLLLEDDCFNMTHIPSEVTTNFNKKPTLKELARWIEINQERQQLIRYYHQERAGIPIFVIGDIDSEVLKKDSGSQPIIHISYRNNGRFLTRSEDIVNTIKLCCFTGYYYLCGTATEMELITAVKNKLLADGFKVSFIGSYDTRSLQSLAVIYQDEINDTIRSKMGLIKKNVIRTSRKYNELANVVSNYSNQINSSRHLIILGPTTSGKTELLKTWLYNFCDNETSVLPLYCDYSQYKDNPILQCLLSHGFAMHEISAMTEQECIFFIDNIDDPKEIKHVLSTTLPKFPRARFIFAANPGLNDESDYQQVGTDNIHLTHSQYFIKHSVVDDDTMAKWFQQYIDKHYSNLSLQEKKNFCEATLHYCCTLSRYLTNNDNTKFSSCTIWQDKNALDAQVQRLFDKYDRLTAQVFKAAPVFVSKAKVNFFNQAIANYFSNLSHMRSTWPNPYRSPTKTDINNTNDLARQNSILTIYHGQSSGEPLFLLPPITGEESFSTLAQHLKKTRPIYCFKHPMWADKQWGMPTAFNTLEEQAKFFGEWILKIAPTGRISLAGWSFGGLLAYEIGRWLQQDDNNRSVDYIGIIDTPSPRVTQELIRNPQQHKELLLTRLHWVFAIYKIAEIDIFKNSIAQIEIAGVEKADYIWQQLEEFVAEQNLKNKVHILQIIHICRDNYRQSLLYQLKTLNLSGIQLYQAAKCEPNGYYPLIQEQSLGWPIRKGTIIPESNHFSLTQDHEMAKILAAHLQNDLDLTQCLIEAPIADEKIRNYVNNCKGTNKYVPLSYYDINSDSTVVEPCDLRSLWQQICASENTQAYVLLGEAGSGKSVSIQYLFQQLAEQYLNCPTQQKIPLYINLSDYSKDVFSTFFTATLALNYAQLNYLQQRHLFFLLDGIDEIGAELFLASLDSFPVDKKSASFIFGCKSHYYTKHPTLRQTIQRFCKPKEIELAPLTVKQQIGIIEVNLPSHAQSHNTITEQLDQYVGIDLKQNPLRLIMLVSTLDYFSTKTTNLDQDSVATLYEHYFKSLTKKSEFDYQVVTNFAKRLAVYLYTRDNISSSPSYPWERQTTSDSTLLKRSRVDTESISYTLHLQNTPTGLSFNHHSQQEYFMSLVLWDEIIGEQRPFTDYILNRILLCYEHDLLDFIADQYNAYVYSDYIFHIKRRQLVQAQLLRLFTSAKNNPNYKILVANVLSIIAACKDRQLKFPIDYKNIHLAPVNLANSFLAGVDFSGVTAEQAILSGAYLHGAKIPSQWSLTYKRIKQHNIHSLTFLNDRSAAMVTKLDAVKWQIKIAGKETSLAVALTPISSVSNSIADNIEDIIVHPDGQHYAVLSQFTDKSYQKGENIYYSEGSYRLQLFKQGVLVHNYHAGYSSEYCSAIRLSTIEPQLANIDSLCAARVVYFVLYNGSLYYINRALKICMRLTHMVGDLLQQFNQIANVETVQLDDWEPLDGLQFIKISALIGYEPEEYFDRIQYLQFHPEENTLFALSKEVANFANIFVYREGKQQKIIRNIISKLKSFIINTTAQLLVIDDWSKTPKLLTMSITSPHLTQAIELNAIIPGINQSKSIEAMAAFKALSYLVFSLSDKETNHLYIIDIVTLKLIASLPLKPLHVSMLYVDSKDERIIIVQHNTILVWEWQCNKQYEVYKAARSLAIKSLFVHDSHIYALEKFSKEIINIDLSVIYVMTKSNHSALWIDQLLQHPSKPWLLCVSGSVRLLNIESGRVLWEYERKNSRDLLCACFSTTGKYLFICDKLLIYMYDLEQRKFIKTLQTTSLPDDSIKIQKVIPDPVNPHRLIVSTLGSVDQQLYHWNYQTNEVTPFAPIKFGGLVRDFYCRDKYVYIFINCGRLIVNKIADNIPTFFIVDAEKSSVCHSVKWSSEFGTIANAIVATPCDFNVIMLLRNAIVMFKDAAMVTEYDCNNNEIYKFDPNTNALCAAHSKDGDSYLVTGHSDGTVAFWSLKREIKLLFAWRENRYRRITSVICTQANLVIVGDDSASLYWYDTTELNLGIKPKLIHCTAHFPEQSYTYAEENTSVPATVDAKYSRFFSPLLPGPSAAPAPILFSHQPLLSA